MRGSRWPARCGIAAALLAVASASGTATAAPRGLVLAADRLVVHFRPGLEGPARRVLELAVGTDTMLARRLGHRPAGRVDILLLGAPGEAAGRAEGAGAGPLMLGRRPLVVTCTGSAADLRRAVGRELARSYLDDLLGGGPAPRRWLGAGRSRAPAWFREGVVEHLTPGTDPEAGMLLRDGVVEGLLPPLDEAEGAWARAEGGSAIAALVARRGEGALRGLLDELGSAHGFGGAFRRAAGLPPRRFEEQWREELRRTLWPQAAVRDDPASFARALTDHGRDGSTCNVAAAVSPQGDRVAFVGDRSRFADVWVVSARDGRQRRRVARGAGALSPGKPGGRLTWSPDGSQLARVVRRGGRDGIEVVGASDGRVRRRIAAPCDALCGPAWSPDGAGLVVSGVLDGWSDLWRVDVGSGAWERLTRDAWDDRDPCWTPDGRVVTFASDRPVAGESSGGGEPAAGHGLHDLVLADGRIVVRPAVAGDARVPAWSPDGRELAFVRVRDGTSDLFLLEADSGRCLALPAVPGGVTSLSWSRFDDRLVFSAYRRGGCDVFAVREPLTLDASRERLRRDVPAGTSLAVGGGTLQPAAAAPLVEARPDRVRLPLERATMGLRGGTGLGCVGTVRVALSDWRGTQGVLLAVDAPGRPLRETDALLLYRRRAGRWELGAGGFQLRHTGVAGRTAMDEALNDARLLSARSLGVRIGASRSLEGHRRVEMELAQARLDRAAVDGGGLVPLTAPSLSLVQDDALWGPGGPVNGGRWRLTLGAAAPWLPRAPAWRSATVDARHYWRLVGGYVFAGRVLAGRNEGRDAPAFRLGGFPTLRGFPVYGMAGTRMAVTSVEVRFPFLERLGVVGPLPVRNFGASGVVFADAGMAWDRDTPLRLLRPGSRRLESPRLSFGLGLRTVVGGLVLKLDGAWRTDLAETTRPRWEFSIGPEF